MSDCNLEQLINAGVIDEQYRDAAEFIDAINKLSTEEVEALIKIGKKIENFNINTATVIQPRWC